MMSDAYATSDGYRDGWSPAHEAVASKDYAALAAILREPGGADAFLYADGDSLLHYVAGRGDEQAARLLLEAGCAKSMKSFDDDGMSPMIRAAWAGHERIVALMLASGAHADERSEAAIDDTALIVAVCRGNLEIVRLLAGAGADVGMEGWMGLSARYHARALLLVNPKDPRASAIAAVVEGSA